MNDKEKLQYIQAEIVEILAKEPLFNDLDDLKERLTDMQWVIEEVKGSDHYIFPPGRCPDDRTRLEEGLDKHDNFEDI